MKSTIALLSAVVSLTGTSIASESSNLCLPTLKATTPKVSINTDTVSTKAAATTTSVSTKTISDLYKKLDDSAFGARYLMENQASAKVDGVTTVHSTYLDYTLDKYHKFTIKPSFSTFLGAENKEKKTTYNSTQFRIYRLSVLNKKDHGVGYTAQLRNTLNNGRTKNEKGITSSHMYLGYFSKSFGKLSLLSQHFYSVNNRTNRVEKQASSSDYFDLVATYSITDNLYVSVNPYYYRAHKVSGDEVLTTSSFQNALEIGYTVNYGRGFDIALNYESSMASKSEGKALKFAEPESMLKEGAWNLSVYTSFF